MGFPSTLFHYPGAGGWTFAPIPEEHAPPATEPWGRTPVTARAHGTLLPLPKRVRGKREAGDVVTVEIFPRVPFEPG